MTAGICFLLTKEALQFLMNPGTLAAAMAGAQSGAAQMVMAAKMIRMNADAEASIANIIAAAQQNMTNLANLAAGIGQNVDIIA